MRIPIFPFAARSAKSPVSQVEHERIPSSWHQPCCLRSPLLQRLPNAAIVCLRPGMLPRPRAGRDLLQAAPVPMERKGDRPHPHGQKGRQTPPYRAQIHTQRYPAIAILQKKRPPTQPCHPTRWKGTGGAHLSELVPQHRPPAANGNAEQEHRALQVTGSFSCTSSLLVNTCNI